MSARARIRAISPSRYIAGQWNRDERLFASKVFLQGRHTVKRTFCWSLVIIFATSLAVDSMGSTQSGNSQSVEQEVRALEEQRRQALLRSDSAALDRLIADSYLATLGDGQVVRKAEALAVNRAGARQVESWEETDLVIRVYGDTAVVTGLAAVKDQLTAGTTASQILRNETGARDFTFRFTHIWAKLNGRWQLVGRHIGQSRQTQASTELRAAEEIVRLLHEWGAAMARRDAQALSQLLADDFTFVSPRGRLITKAVYVANRDTSGTFASEVARFDDVSVRVFGSFAVATSRHTSTSQGVDAGLVREQTGEYTRTDTLIKVDGRWRALATQLTPIGFSGAHAASDVATLNGLNDDALQWSGSPMFPGAQFAVLYGQSYTGGYAVRLRRPNGYFEKPHHHESDEHVSVLSGAIHVGVGESVNRASTRAFRAGGYVVIPARTLHYSWAEGAVVENVSWNGPAVPVWASERTEMSLPRTTLASYVGTYRFADGAALTITLDGATLMAQLSGAPAPFAIFAESETRFFVKSAPPGSSVGISQQIEFVRDASSVVTGLSLGNRKAARVSR